MTPGLDAARFTTFDRTYEGLKLAATTVGQPGEVAFDRTYEGLKHITVDGARDPRAAFDRTYEGLKRRRGGRNPDPGPLLTVPMRV